MVKLLEIWNHPPYTGEVISIVSKFILISSLEKAMGDRALVQFKNKDESSPVLYTHWYGDTVLEIIQDTYDEMVKERRKPNDIEKAFMHFLANMMARGDKDCSCLFNQHRLLTEDDSHGDAGCLVVDVSESDDKNPWKIYSAGGYCEDAEDVLPLDEVPPIDVSSWGNDMPLPPSLEQVKRLGDRVNKFYREMQESIARHGKIAESISQEVAQMLEAKPVEDNASTVTERPRS